MSRNIPSEAQPTKDFIVSDYNPAWNPHYNPTEKNLAEHRKMHRYDVSFGIVYGGQADENSDQYKEAKAFMLEAEKEATGGKEGYDVGLEIKKDWGLNKVIGINPVDQTCIKELVVWPNCMLSLQSHLGREEVWEVQSGVLTLIMDDKLYEVSDEGVFDITHGKRDLQTDSKLAVQKDGHWSIILPKGSIHCMINTSDKDVVVIETQSGITLEADNRRYIDQLRDLPESKYRATIPLPSELHYRAAQLYWEVEEQIAQKNLTTKPNWKVSYHPQPTGAVA